MFEVHGNCIRISAGDTGVIRFEAEGIELTPSDRAVFTVKRRGGGAVIRKIVEPEGNAILVPFVNGDTEKLHADSYEWDIRYVLDAQLDGRGEVTDGREVITPFAPGNLQVMKVVGDV